MLDVSVIICAYTEARWGELVAAVRTVERQVAPPQELIVVIDHNPDLLARAKAAFTGARVIENLETAGLAGARNTGIATSSQPFVAFLDDDAFAAEDWLARLREGYRSPDVLGVGGAIEPSWPSGRPAWFPEEFDWVVGCTYRGLPETAGPVRNLIGANMSFRREVFERVTFYSGIGHAGGRPFGGSDPDFCIRVTQAFPGAVLRYEPAARVWHQVSPERARWDYFRLRCFNEGLSKSVLTRRVGSKDGLSSEWAYTLGTLPRGVVAGARDAIRERSPAGLSRSAAIVAGLALTTAGYVKGKAEQRWQARRGRRASGAPLSEGTAA